MSRQEGSLSGMVQATISGSPRLANPSAKASSAASSARPLRWWARAIRHETSTLGVKRASNGTVPRPTMPTSSAPR